MILKRFPPMGVYETLFRFADATRKYMGDAGTHLWAQGYPLTTQIPGGPSLPTTIKFDHLDLKYPKATGDGFNERLFEHEAGILPGRLCDMARSDDCLS